MTTTYIDLPNSLIAHGPYVHREVALHSFFIEADRGKVQKFLDDGFETPSGGAVKYQLLTKKLLLSAANIGVVTSNGDPTREGIISEIDVGLWAVAIRTKPFSWTPRSIPLWLFVDSGAAMAAGREVYGFPKGMGIMKVPGNAPSNAGFSVNAQVFPNFGPGERASVEPVFEARPETGVQEAEAPPVLSSVQDAYNATINSLDPFDDKDLGLDDMKENALGATLFSGVKMAFLKQFPAIEDTRNACYRAIVEADSKTTDFRGAGFTSASFEVNIHSYASHDFQGTLGIQPGWQSVGRSLWGDFDFDMEFGEVVHQS